MKKELTWFVERIGTKVKASSPKAFNGEMLIKNETHAKYLCNVAQPYLHYSFEDIKPC
jgi:hypothetical protein